MNKCIVPVVAAVMVALVIFVGCAAPAEPTVPSTPAEPTAPTTPTEPTAPSIPPEPEGVYAQPNPVWGVAIKPDGTPYKLAHACSTLIVPLMAWGDGYGHSLIERAGGEATTLNADFSLEAQIAQIEDMIVMGQEGFFVNPIASDALAPVVDKAWDAGLPCFVYDAPIYSENVVSYVTHNNFTMGEVAAQALADYARDHDMQLHVYELWGPFADEGCQDRHRGYQSVAEASPWIRETIESPDTQFDPDFGMSAIIDAFSANPELNAVFAHAMMASAYTEAMRELDRLHKREEPGFVPFVQACGGDYYAYESMMDGYVLGNSEHSFYHQVDLLVKCMFSYVCCGQPVPEEVVIPSRLITTQNVDDLLYGEPTDYLNMLNYEPDYNKWPILTWPADYPQTPTPDMKKPGY